MPVTTHRRISSPIETIFERKSVMVTNGVGFVWLIMMYLEKIALDIDIVLTLISLFVNKIE